MNNEIKNTILAKANEIVKGAAFTDLKQTTYGHQDTFLIVMSKDFAIYGGYRHEKYFAIYNGAAYRLI